MNEKEQDVGADCFMHSMDPLTALKDEAETATEAAGVERSSGDGDGDDEEESNSNGGGKLIVSESTNNNEESAGASSWDFSSRKVLVQNVNRYDDVKRMNKLANKWVTDLKAAKNLDVQIDKIKKPPKDNWMIVTLKEEVMVQYFIDYISEMQPRTKNGDIMLAKRPADGTTNTTSAPQGNRKREKSDTENAVSLDPLAKRQKMVQEARRPVTEDEVKDAVIPLWRQSPEDQLSSKIRGLIKGCALKIVKETKARFHALSRDKSRKTKVQPYKWLGAACPIRMSEIVPVPSPIRNKSEFTFGYRYLFDDNGVDKREVDEDAAASGGESSNTKECRRVPSLGICARGWAGGVSLPHACENIPSEACAIVDLVEAFLLDSPLPPYDTFHHTGIWRTLTVRSSRRTRECMVIIVHSPADGGVGEKAEEVSYADSFESEKQRLLSLLTTAALQVPGQEPLKVTSVYFQEFDGVSHPPPEHPVQHGFGKTSLTERVGPCSFQISPGAFFQVNTEGAEILYGKVIEKVRETVKDPQKTLLFDVCCGTGTIGISCLKAGVVGHVIGVDISQPAIRDAEQNAEINGLGCSSDNSANNSRQLRFIAARAEEVLGRELDIARDTGFEFVAVVDPAREGLHSNVCKTLRANNRIQRIVYVSCNPTGTLVRDAALFCAPPTKRYSGRPFAVESATPVDMFPLTTHCELVMTFDRLKDEDLKDS